MIHIDHITGAIVAADHARAVALDTTSTLGPPIAIDSGSDRACCHRGEAGLENPDERLNALRLAHREHILLDAGWSWAVIGLEEDRPIVYGLGHPDGDGAIAAAARRIDWYMGGKARVIIPPTIAARVYAGEVGCDSLGIRVDRAPQGTIRGADLAGVNAQDLVVDPSWFPDGRVGHPWIAPITATGAVANYRRCTEEQVDPVFGWRWTWRWIARCLRAVRPDPEHTRSVLERMADDAERRALAEMRP